MRERERESEREGERAREREGEKESEREREIERNRERDIFIYIYIYKKKHAYIYIYIHISFTEFFFFFFFGPFSTVLCTSSIVFVRVPKQTTAQRICFSVVRSTLPGISMYVKCTHRRPRRRYHGISGRRLVEMLRNSSRES